MRGGLLACACGLVACSGTTGTIDVSLTTAPGSTILDGAETLRVTITNPHSVTEATRGSGSAGFALEVDFNSIGSAGAVIIEALDGTGATLAVGETPPFPLTAIDASIVVYMAAPRTFGAAPLALDAARSGLAVAPLTYGGAIAGGSDAAGSASSELQIYNAFDHSFVSGLPLPEARSHMAASSGASGDIYLFGGFDATGSAAGTLLRFDPSVSPDGEYTGSATYASFARADQAILADGIETFVVTGAPALDLDGDNTALTARTDLATVPPEGTSVVGSDETELVVFAGDGAGSTGCERLHAARTVTALAIAGAARTAHSVVPLAATGTLAIIGGALAGTPTLDAVIVDANAGTATTVTGALSVARLHAAIAATPRYIVVAGGSDGSGVVSATADLLDGTTLALIATIPMVVGRTGASALALPNEQVLVVGGLDATGAPSDLIELFTPDAPPASQ